MDQDQLRATLSALIAERARAGESLAKVGAVIAQLTDPPRAPLTRQYVQMLESGKGAHHRTARPRYPKSPFGKSCLVE